MKENLSFPEDRILPLLTLRNGTKADRRLGACFIYPDICPPKYKYIFLSLQFVWENCKNAVFYNSD